MMETILEYAPFISVVVMCFYIGYFVGTRYARRSDLSAAWKQAAKAWKEVARGAKEHGAWH
jgi:sugar phosphate isomerase/epimerase